ncbi:hypothetical protein LX99_02158 [Mucilaginibacter oryzae]|uniref:Uncharacterized protein n=1 Tax=Mucilaginibacter oryzae TaxID=468058 RepID=A0A316HCR9_9SPHI|nr:hypothetical protein LX99_02158 [Mucilaginibacter oryzae]
MQEKIRNLYRQGDDKRYQYPRQNPLINQISGFSIFILTKTNQYKGNVAYTRILFNNCSISPVVLVISSSSWAKSPPL